MGFGKGSLHILILRLHDSSFTIFWPIFAMILSNSSCFFHNLQWCNKIWWVKFQWWILGRSLIAMISIFYLNNVLRDPFAGMRGGRRRICIRIQMCNANAAGAVKMKVLLRCFLILRYSFEWSEDVWHVNSLEFVSRTHADKQREDMQRVHHRLDTKNFPFFAVFREKIGLMTALQIVK